MIQKQQITKLLKKYNKIYKPVPYYYNIIENFNSEVSAYYERVYYKLYYFKEINQLKKLINNQYKKCGILMEIFSINEKTPFYYVTKKQIGIRLLFIEVNKRYNLK